MEVALKSRGGRPRTFDREQAVDVAMRMFWRHGYEGVSIGDLTEAIGIAAPSLYAAFGSKAQLFRETLKRYELVSGPSNLSVFDNAETLEDAVRQMLNSSIRMVTSPEGERGCMISSGMIACHADHEELALELAERRNAYRATIKLKLQFWVGEQKAPSLARYLAAVLQGISIQSRDGATPAELAMIVDEVTAALASRHANPAR